MNSYTLKDSGDRREFKSGAVRDMQVGKGRCDLLPLAELSTLIENMNEKMIYTDRNKEYHYEEEYLQSVISMDDNPDSLILMIFNHAINILNEANADVNEAIIHLYRTIEIFLVRFYKCPETNLGCTLYDVFNSVPADNNKLIERNINGIVYSSILDLARHFEAGARKYGDNNWRKGIPVNVFIDSAIRHFCKFMRGDTDEPHDIAFMWNVICCIWTIKNLGLIKQEEEK